MILNLYSIKDERTEYNAPFTSKNNAEAERSFATLAQDKETTIGRFPEDYALYLIGNMDMDKGIIVACEPTLVVRAKELINV